MIKSYKVVARSAERSLTSHRIDEGAYEIVKRLFFDYTKQPDIIFAAVLVAESATVPFNEEFYAVAGSGCVTYKELKWEVDQRWVPEMGKLEEVGYYVAIVDQDGGSVFEGTLDQYDNCFGIAIGATEAQCQAHAKSQGWSLFRKLA